MSAEVNYDKFVDSSPGSAVVVRIGKSSGVKKFNENHDENGRFASSEGGSSGGSTKYIGHSPDFNATDKKDRWQEKQDIQAAMRAESRKVMEMTNDEHYTLLQYTSHTNQPVNKLLNGGMADLDPKNPVLVKARDSVAELDKIMEKTQIDSNMKTYRGVAEGIETLTPELATALDTPGSVIQMNGFISTSLSPDQAMMFTSAKGGRLLEVHVPAGTHSIYMRGVSASPTEEEVLLDRGMTYRVIESKQSPILTNRGTYPDVKISVLEVVHAK